MNVIIHTNNNQYSVFGVNYFLRKYGFAPENIEEKLSLKIIWSNNNTDPDQRINGWVIWKEDSLPVLVTPPPIGDPGNLLLSYQNGSAEYPCAIITNSDIIISLDIFQHLGLFLSGHLEKTWAIMKEEKKDIIAIPFVDCYCDFLLSCIQTNLNKQNIPLVYKTFWPEGKSCAVCLTHDVDELKKTYQWITRPWMHMKKGNFRGLYHQYLSFKQKIRGKEPYWTFDTLLHMEDELGIKSSFYFLRETSIVRISDKKTWRHLGRRYDWDSPQVKAVMKKMNDGGWEVGLHSSFDSYNDHEKILLEKNALEHALGTSCIVGVRQHNLNLKIPETWIGHEKSGLLYDTTLGYNDCIGFRWGTCLPFHPYIPSENRTLNLLEIPLIIEDLPFFRNKSRCKDTVKIIEEVIDHQGVLTLLWHHSVFDNHEYPNWGTAYRQIIEYCKKRGAWISTGKQIFQWWLQREASNFRWNFDGKKLSISADRNMPKFISVRYPENLMFKSVRNAAIQRFTNGFFTIKAENQYIEIEFDDKENSI